MRTIVLIGCVKSVQEGEGVKKAGKSAYVLNGWMLPKRNGLRAKRARNRHQSRIGTLLLHLLLLLVMMTSGVVGVPELGGEVRLGPHVLLHDKIPARRPSWRSRGGGRGADRAPDGRLAGSLVKAKNY